MPFDPKVPSTPQFWANLERRLREAVRLRARQERRVQFLQSAAGAVATIASFGAGLVIMVGPAAPATTAVARPAGAHMSIDALLADAGQGYGHYETTSELLASGGDLGEKRTIQTVDRDEAWTPSHILVQQDPVVGSVVGRQGAGGQAGGSGEDGSAADAIPTTVQAQ